MAGSKRRIKIFMIVLVVCIAILIGIDHFTGVNPVSLAVKSVFSPFQNGFSYVIGKAEEGIDFLREMRAYKEENTELTQKVNELEASSRENSYYKEENEQLRSLLDMKNSMGNYTSLAATVIAYNSDGKYDTMEINRGTLTGVKAGNCVITSDGTVGTISEAGPNWATVSTIIKPSAATGIRVSRTGGLGVVEGNTEFGCKLTFLDKNSNIIVGDILETSGSGGVYPAGIPVGRIKDISVDNIGTIEYATVEPIVDFSRIRNVLVINGMK